MATKDNEEFKYAVREIAIKALNIDNPYERVRVAQWVKKLAQMPEDDLEMSRIRNEYAQLLRIQVRNGNIHGIFKSPPPESHNMAPLAENLANLLSKTAHKWNCKCSCKAGEGSYCKHIIATLLYANKCGPIAPVLKHSSPDGRAYVCAKQMNGGVFAYMAITPDAFK